MQRKELLDLVSNIAFYRFSSPTGLAKIGKIALLCAYQATWRLVLADKTSVIKFWSEIENQEGIDIEEIIQMTSSFVFQVDRAEYADAADHAAKSLGWLADANVTEAHFKLCAKVDTYREILRDNPWVMFMYLLGHSDIITKLSEVKVVLTPVPAAATEAKS